MTDDEKEDQVDRLLKQLAAHRASRLAPLPIEDFQRNALLREVARTCGRSRVKETSLGPWLKRFWPALALGVSVVVLAVVFANQALLKVGPTRPAKNANVDLASAEKPWIKSASVPPDTAKEVGKTSAAPGNVLGLDLLSSQYFGLYQMWTREGSKENAAKAYEQMIEQMKKNPRLAGMALQHLSPEHAKYHPHMTKDCSLLKGLKPGDKFDAAGHAQAIISESLACPICNPPSGSDDGGKPNPRPRPQPGDSDSGKIDPHSATKARDSLRYASGMKTLPDGMDDRFFNSLNDAEAVAMAEMWTEFAAPGGKKEREMELETRVAELAQSMKDSTDYATSESGDAKYPYTCNRFVYDVLVAAGLPMPLRERWADLIPPKYPPLAGDYADPLHEIPGLPVIHGLPRPGDIVAVPMDSENASGHVGILLSYDPVTGMGRSIYVSSAKAPFTVREGNFGFRPIDVGVVFRRPTWKSNGP